ncbi:MULTISPECIES: RecQ family ATP-dependent DNA helicase [Nonomuraea]|uniref:ATP-dependent DNA helicase RecQ n=1 Tax=Nonomuraea ferruginea TaxID=46174 RepID=A0ABT4T3V6_9ACTN|nr:RecQ family ATP-dependent DNA helicase [Nonomuraea ferruginea]MDA0643691.1 RecQ family ATP-dependent DNA helicase [Nonomuraea ferruginea]
MGTSAERRVERVAREALGLDELRPGQPEAMAALAEGRDTLVVMPTGGGKSAVYQVPALLLDGPTLVVSPLIALQRDQVEALRERDEQAVRLDAGTSKGERESSFESLRAGETEFLFCAPEQLARPDVVRELAAAKPSLLVVDEAHCVSAWGHDFRPDYLRLGAVADALGRPVVAALTATAAPPVRAEIVERLRMRDPLEVVCGFDRPNISLEVRGTTGDGEDVAEAVEALAKPGLVYTATRKRAAELAGRLGERGVRAAAYHAGMRRADRDAVQEAFMAGELDVVVATNAFGMGIDKPDVRFVVHAQVPGSLDSYYQEIGRAGRDGEPAAAVLFYRAEDLGMQRFFTGGLPDEDALAAVARALGEEGGRTDRKHLRERLGITARRVTSLLNLLEKAGAVRLGTRSVAAAEDAPAPEEAARAAREVAERHREVERTRLEMMRRYAETRDCRRGFLLGYFGERLPGPCGACDTCLAGTASHPEPAGDVRFPMHARVEHVEWGPGEVIRREEDRLTVLFHEGGYRELLLSAVTEEGLLREAG